MGRLRFVLGPSGSGKTTEIYKELITRASENPKTNFLIVVPDQFTMQTQWDISNMWVPGKSRGGILNIDVLSFGRLTHRIIQEVGWKDIPVLDDTGKCLVLQRVAGRIEENLPLLGSRLHRQGYIHEVKSVISEFMQYGISPDDIDRLLEKSPQGALASKLKDLKLIYRSFNEYIENNFITREEKLGILRQLLPQSAILPGSVVVFDGFTGFTPIQADVVEDIMALTDETIVSLVLGEDTKIEDTTEEQSLFYLSGKTYRDLRKRAESRKVEIEDNQFCHYRGRVPEIEHIEKYLFRNGTHKYNGKIENIHFAQMSTIPEEVHQTGLEICRLLREDKQLQYRNIVIVTGDPETYAPYVEREFSRLGIPYFLDRTSGIRMNPLVEIIRSVLGLYIDNFTQDSVIRYLRSGLSGFDDEKIDRLDIYIRKCGIRGRKKWQQVFSRKTDDMDSDDETALNELNELRENFVKSLEVLKIKNSDTAENYVNNLYDFLLAIDAPGQLKKYEEDFRNENDAPREKEYGQIFQKVMELLEQVQSLMGSDELTLKEFYEILDAGFGEIRVGTIPQTVDKVMVGDIERSRVPSVVTMFFLGVNDGNIPGSSDKGGILSDIDRENLKENSFELAPTPREAMFTQRMYLYMNMTKPVRDLYISWASLDTAGKSLRPSYICEVLKKMFPQSIVMQPEKRPVSDQIVTPEEGIRYLADGLRRFVEAGPFSEYGSEDCDKSENENRENNSREVFTLYSAYSEDENSLKIRNMTETAAFSRYVPEKLGSFLAQKLYCGNKDDTDENDIYLRGSVSKLETYAQCPYRFYLTYGLKLKEDREFAIDNRDTGIICHDVLEKFFKTVIEEKKSWKTLTDEFVREKIHTLTLAATDTYGQAVFQDKERTRYVVSRLESTLVCTVKNLKYQITKGEFEPAGVEIPFKKLIDMPDGENGEKRHLVLSGVIDRMDTAEDEDGKLVRIVDYKSSDHKLDLKKVYDGQQLQLALYMGQELDGGKNKPAGMLYYHIDNPVLEGIPDDGPADDGDDAVLNAERIKALKMKGIVSADVKAIGLQDKDLAGGSGTSDILPVGYKKDGGFTSSSAVLGEEDFLTVIKYAENISAEKGSEILGGNIKTEPLNDANVCAYCAYKNSCAFDKKIPGYEKRTPAVPEADQILACMKEKNNGN